MGKRLSYCGDLVRHYDRDRFLLSLGVPASRREALWALFAFNHEIAKTREVVSEPQLGLIRLQWWRDAIAGIYQGVVPAHEVAEPLAAAIAAYDLPQEDFQGLIEAREKDLDSKAFSTFIELERYAESTAAPLSRLALQIIGQEEDKRIIRAVSIGYALCGLVRAAPFHAAQGRVFLPRGTEDTEAALNLAVKYLDSAMPQSRYLQESATIARYYITRIRKLPDGAADPRARSLSPIFLIGLIFSRFK